MLLGPMLAGIVLAMRGKTVTVPRPCFLASQAVIGCLIARYFEPGLLATLANDWPVFVGVTFRSEEHTSELQSLMRISYAVFCLKKKKQNAQTLRNTRENTDSTTVIHESQQINETTTNTLTTSPII